MVVSHLSELVEWLDCLYDITSFHKQANQLKQVKWALAASWSFLSECKMDPLSTPHSEEWKQSTPHSGNTLHSAPLSEFMFHSDTRIFGATVQQSRIRNMLDIYQWYLDKHPVLTKALTSASLAAIGDITSQYLLKLGKAEKTPYSWRSTLAFSGFSFLITGPITHFLHQFLEAVVPRRSKFSSIRKVILERLIFAPPYLLALFYTVARLEGKNHSEAWSIVKSIYWSALLKNWIIWGLAQYFNMRFVPIKYRVLYANLIALIWNSYIAIIKRQNN